MAEFTFSSQEKGAILYASTAMGGTAAVLALEETRSLLINPASSLLTRSPEDTLACDTPFEDEAVAQGFARCPVIAEEEVPKPVYQTLEHSGDLLEGYGFALASMGLITAIAWKRFSTLNRKARLSIAATVSVAAVTVAESGLLNGQQPNYADVPAAIAGAGLFTLLYSKVSSWCDRKNQPAEHETSEPQE